MENNNKLIPSIALIASMSFFLSFSSSTAGYASSVDEQSLNKFSNQVETLTLVELSLNNEIKPLYSDNAYGNADLGGSHPHPGYSGPGKPCGCAPPPTPPHNPYDPTPARP